MQKKAGNKARRARARALWQERDAPTRGPKPALEVRDIVRAAISIADRDGLGAVAMQRVAGEVGVTTMALYRYVASKDELIDRMIEAAGGPAPRRDAGETNWRDGLRGWVKECTAIYRRHPWFLQAATARRRVMGPHELEWMNAALRDLDAAGLKGREQLEAFLLVIGHVRSQAEFSAGEAKGMSAGDWVRTTQELATRYPERYSAVLAAMGEGTFGADRRGLEFGLECILEGIEGLVRRGRSSAAERR